MQNPICISTGCIYKLSDDRNDLIEKLRELSPVGIELSFVYPEYLLNFDINKNNLDYLKSLKFNSIHAPGLNMVYGANKTSERVLQKISELYKQINARNVVFHKGQIENYDLIMNNNFVASIENDDWRKPKHNVEDVKNALDRNKGLRFTFDFAHAVSISPLSVHQYINNFKDETIEIHLSVINKDSEEHDFLHKYDNVKIRSLIQSLKVFSVPVVLEATIFDLGGIELLRKEMEYIGKI